MEASLQISSTSSGFGKMVPFNQKGSCKEKFLQHRTMISCQNGRPAKFYQVLSIEYCSKFVGLHEIKKAYRSKALKLRAANFYHVLSLDCSKFVGPDEIKKAYRSKALKLHPDVCPPSEKEESTRRFIELQMAYETLSDPISRELYDRELGLVDAEGRTRHGMSDSKGKRVWERQIAQLGKRPRQKMERRKKTGM